MEILKQKVSATIKALQVGLVASQGRLIKADNESEKNFWRGKIEALENAITLLRYDVNSSPAAPDAKHVPENQLYKWGKPCR